MLALTEFKCHKIETYGMEVISQDRGGGDGSGRVGIEVVLLATMVGVSTLYNILSASPRISVS